MQKQVHRSLVPTFKHSHTHTHVHIKKLTQYLMNTVCQWVSVTYIWKSSENIKGKEWLCAVLHTTMHMYIQHHKIKTAIQTGVYICFLAMISHRTFNMNNTAQITFLILQLLYF